MEPLFEFGLEASRWLQAQYPGWEPVMQALTAAGRFEAYLAILPLIYWSLHKPFGRSLIYVAALGQVISGLGKQAFRGPRPYWLDPGVGLSEEASYGVPSSHASISAIVYGYLALWVRRGPVWLLAILLTLLISLSRVYLGVHMLHDVLAGLLLGIVILITFWLWERRLAEGFARRILGQRLLIAFLVPLVFALAFLLLRMLLPLPDTSVAWAGRIGPGEAVSLTEAVQASAVLLGLGWGFVMESSRVRFRVEGAWWKRLLRYLTGIAGVLLIWRGLGAVLPDDPLWLGLPLRFVRYGLLGLWGAYYAPWLFVRLRLAPADPPPQINLTIRPLDKVQS